jgi:archaellum biogenesis ATPase FlaH
MTDINKEMLSDAVILLGKTFNQPKKQHVEAAISLLQKSMHGASKPLTAIKAKDVPEAAADFIKSGVRWYDDWWSGGVRKGELLLYGATPHGGKTHLLVWTGSQFLLEGYRVLSIIGEDLLADVREYYTIGVGGIQEVLDNLWLADMQDMRFGVPEVEAVYESLKAEDSTPDIVVIDHVDLMKTAAGKADWEGVTDVMADLKIFAKRTNTFVITASQANFGRDIKGMERFHRAKVGKAGNADLIIMVNDTIDLEDGMMEYEVERLKARGRKRIHGITKQKTLLCNWGKMSVKDITNGG